MADESKFGQKPGTRRRLSCEEWEALLTDALDGLLPAAEAAAFTAHSETCANCGDLLAHAKQGQEWLGYLHTEPEIPAGLIGKILEQTVGAGSVPLPVIAAAGAAEEPWLWLTPWHRNFHETRLLMTVAMAFFSIALTLNLVGVKLGQPAAGGSAAVADREHAVAGVLHSAGISGAVLRQHAVLLPAAVADAGTAERRADAAAAATAAAVESATAETGREERERDCGAGAGRGAEREWTGYRVQGAGCRRAFSVQRSAFRTATGGRGRGVGWNRKVNFPG